MGPLSSLHVLSSVLLCSLFLIAARCDVPPPDSTELPEDVSPKSRRSVDFGVRNMVGDLLGSGDFLFDFLNPQTIRSVLEPYLMKLIPEQFFNQFQSSFDIVYDCISKLLHALFSLNGGATSPSSGPRKRDSASGSTGDFLLSRLPSHL